MNWGVLHSIATLGAVIAFFAIAWWAYSPKNKQRFEEDARLVLDDEPDLAADGLVPSNLAQDGLTQGRLAKSDFAQCNKDT